jgi:hypothetical protein
VVEKTRIEIEGIEKITKLKEVVAFCKMSLA